MKALFKTNESYTPLIARLTLGLVMFPHGAQKALGWFGGYGFSGTMNFLTDQMHFPAVFAFLAIAAEFVGAIALIVGALSRVAAFSIGVVMAVAIVTAHASNGFFMNWFGNRKGEGFEYHLLALGLALVVVIAGAGKWSIDRLLDKRFSLGGGSKKGRATLTTGEIQVGEEKGSTAAYQALRRFNDTIGANEM